MMLGERGIEVTMHFWVDEVKTEFTLVQPMMATYAVHPPAWCLDDPVALEMHLDHLAKLQFLFDIRRSLQRGEPTYQHLKDRQDYIVRGMMEQYSIPTSKDAQACIVKFSSMFLRAA